MENINWVNVIIEFIGTFVFLSVIMNVAMKGNASMIAPIAIGLGLTVAIYMMNNDMSSNHYNPAVSFMAWCDGRIIFTVLIAYIIAQLAGGYAAFALHRYIIK
jgi:aquaporin Z